MKKSFYKFSSAAILLAILLTACSKKFIEKIPYDSIPLNVALSDQVGVTNALNGAYAQLRSSNLWGRDLPVIGDIQADNTFVETKNSGRYIPQYNYNIVDWNKYCPTWLPSFFKYFPLRYNSKYNNR